MKILSFTNKFNTFSGISLQFSIIRIYRPVRLWIDFPVTRPCLWYSLNPLSHFYTHSTIWSFPANNPPLLTACVQESGYFQVLTAKVVLANTRSISAEFLGFVHLQTLNPHLPFWFIDWELEITSFFTLLNNSITKRIVHWGQRCVKRVDKKWMGARRIEGDERISTMSYFR